MRFIASKARRSMLLMLWLTIVVGLAACHTVRVVPPVSSAPPDAFAPAKKPIVKVAGHIYGIRDTTTIVPGVELVFSMPRADSAAQRWRDVTQADGSYQVTVPAGATYQIALNKDGVNIETQEFAVPEGRADTSSLVKNFYLSGPGDTCCIDRMWLKNAYFDTNRAILRPKSMLDINNTFRFLKDNVEAGIVIEGHAEPREVPAGQADPQQYLLRLGQRRAQAAYAYLVKMGISENRLNPVSYGAKRPAAPNDSPENRQLNRRVEFKLVGLEYIPAKSGHSGAKSSYQTPGLANKQAVSSTQKLKNAPAKLPSPKKSGVRSKTISKD